MTEKLEEALWEAWLELKRKGKIKREELKIERPADEGRGDYACSLALKVANAESPLEIAKLLAEKLQEKKMEGVGEIEVVAPGFVNFRLSDDWLIRQGNRVLDGKKFLEELGKTAKRKVMVIDYSAPNIAKPFGIGHLRSTNIGQAIYNLYRVLGWKTIGDNHLGDWGTQFGKLMVAIKSWWEADLSALTIADLEELYVRFHREAEDNEELNEQARMWFKQLEEGNEEAVEMWEFCVKVSLREFERVYQALGVEIDVAYGESFYSQSGWMDKVLADVKTLGLGQTSEGALVMEIPGEKVPAMLVKSDGGTTYLLRDLATIKFRQEKWNPDLLVYEVGADHKLHFRQVFAAAGELGYLPKAKFVHVAHGMMRWKEGKFSTRKGTTIKMEEVLQEAVRRAKALAEGSQTGQEMSEEEKEMVAKTVGIGAVKFNDLKQEPERDVMFDFDKALMMEGYAAPYLQYTFSRCRAILGKAGGLKEGFDGKGEINEEERGLLRSFWRFEEVIMEAAERFAPNLLCQYLFDLSQRYSEFYTKHRIVGSEKEKFRLWLTAVTAKILKQGLEILGIGVAKRM